ncbi:MAG: tetraacyldisaccharide 4'-kinase [Cyanobacteria bacterium REEB67]|nr:tetraacyldisaccharide 4'-kinase [Cyanobacteria bacterium REEB67]
MSDNTAVLSEKKPIVERLESLAESPYMKLLLWPASLFYGLGAWLRGLFFDLGLARSVGAPVPVISVGNITVGGTGKTPVVIDLATRMIASGVKVAILSRGYGRLTKASTVVVSAGYGPIAGVLDSGDEPSQMAQAVPRAVIIVDSLRSRAAYLAVKKYGANLLLLDDGFQHRKLRRDLDVVLFDYNDLIDELKLLPAGRLREPLSGLARASTIVVTKIPSAERFDSVVVDDLARLSGRLAKLAPKAVLRYCRFTPRYLINGESGESMDLADLRGKKVFVFSGIATPDSLVANVHETGAELSGLLEFGDHHWYSPGDLAAIEKSFNESGAAYIITTEKDMVRLPQTASLRAKTLAMVLATEWVDANGSEINAPDFWSNLRR